MGCHGAPDPRTEISAAVPSVAFDLQGRYQSHWCWRPIASPQPPPVSLAQWPILPIDHFILAKLEQADITPAPAADKRTWLRRVYLDLVGLPPRVDQIHQFLADDSPDAFQRVVNELLDSPHYGEKWARHWMDLVRYSETYGHEFDYPIRHAHEYRDYLIRAFNADVPYDQFVREQIAGDLIAKPRRNPEEDFNESIIGTGFWYFHDATHAPTDVLGNEASIIDNQLDVFGKSFLGLTVACARCHDHKFDAISTADYYALSAFIQSSCRQYAPLDPGRKIENINRQIQQHREDAAMKLRSIDEETRQRLAPAAYYDAAMKLCDRLEADQASAEIESQWIEQAALDAGLDRERLERWVRNADGIDGASERCWDGSTSVLMQDFNSTALPAGWTTSGSAFHVVTDDLLTAEGQVLKPGTISSRVLGRKQRGTLRSPTFEITAPRIHVRLKASANVRMLVVIDNYQMAIANGLLFNGTLIQGKDIDTQGRWVWKSFGGDLGKYVGHKAYLEFIDDNEGYLEVDEIRFSDAEPPATKVVEHQSKSIDDRWNLGIEALRLGRIDALIGWLIETGLVSIDDLSEQAGESIAAAGSLADQVPAPRYVLAMAQGTPEDAHIYIRGSHMNPGDSVPPRFLEALGGKQADRLELAEMVASADNPLTARVIVNRIWHHLFGRGIVATVDDFGPQGEPASHPELLDFLASDLINHGWSLKHTIGQIALSQTYRQSSIADPEMPADRIAMVDPTNNLLHRMPVRRLASETIRDSILLVSGGLDPKPYGPSVPTHLTSFMTGRGRPSQSGPLDGDGRRSVYLAVTRNFLNPFMLTFDVPSPFGPQGRRSRSNVPAQALTLLNDPFVIEQATKWAQRIMAMPDLDDAGRAGLMMEQAHGVRPTGKQSAALEAFLVRQADLYGTRDIRVWTDLAHSLWNMKAFYYVR